MFDFGDELRIEGYQVPWLIWIQILVLFLLIFLLYCFSCLTSDLSGDNTADPSSASTSSSSSFFNKSKLDHSFTSSLTNRFQHAKVRQSRSIKGEIATSTGRRTGGEDNMEGDCSSSMHEDYISFHPCNYLRLAKIAFLKCFGLDSTSDNSKRSERKKER